MDIQTAKLELVRLIVDIDDPQLIENLIETIGTQSKYFDGSVDNYTREELKLGIHELDKGNRINFDEFIKQV